MKHVLTAALLAIATAANAQTYEQVTSDAILHWHLLDSDSDGTIPAVTGPTGTVPGGLPAGVFTTGPLPNLPNAIKVGTGVERVDVNGNQFLRGADTFAVSFWVRVDTMPGGIVYNELYTFGGDGAKTWGYVARDGEIVVAQSTGHGWIQTRTPRVINEGQWHHIVVLNRVELPDEESSVFDWETLIYVDGVQRATSATASNGFTYQGDSAGSLGPNASANPTGDFAIADFIVHGRWPTTQERAALAAGPSLTPSYRQSPPIGRPASGSSRTIISEFTVTPGSKWASYVDMPNGWRFHNASNTNYQDEGNGWVRVTAFDTFTWRISVEHNGVRRYFFGDDDAYFDGWGGTVFLPPLHQLEDYEPWATLLAGDPPALPPDDRPTSGLRGNVLINLREVFPQSDEFTGSTEIANGWTHYFTPGTALVDEGDGWSKLTGGLGFYSAGQISAEIGGTTRYFEIINDNEATEGTALYLPPTTEATSWEPWTAILAHTSGPPPGLPATGIRGNTIANFEERSPSQAIVWGSPQHTYGGATYYHSVESYPYVGGWTATRLPSNRDLHRLAISYQGTTRYFQLTDPTSDTNSTLYIPPVGEIDQHEPWATLLAQDPPPDCPRSSSDCDADCVPNFRDDTPGCGTGNTDGTGTPDGDRDTDGDGVPDNRDPDPDGDGLIDCRDGDNDGVINVYDRDDDDDGIVDWLDADPDGDGLESEVDRDDDGDCIPDVEDEDQDGDGVPDNVDADLDGDLIPNDFDSDIDGDGIPNDLDSDDDSDGIIDGYAPPELSRVNGSVTSSSSVSASFYGTNAFAAMDVSAASSSAIAFASAADTCIDPDTGLSCDSFFLTPDISPDGCECNQDCRPDDPASLDNWFCNDNLTGGCYWLVTGQGPNGNGTGHRRVECGQECDPDDCDGDGLYDPYDGDTCQCGGDMPTDPGDPPPVTTPISTPCAADPCAPGCPGHGGSGGCPEESRGGDGWGSSEDDCPDYDDDGICDECDVDCPNVGCIPNRDDDGEVILCQDDDGDGECDDCQKDCVVRIIRRLWMVFQFVNIQPTCEELVAETAPLASAVGNPTGVYAPAFTLRVDTCFSDVGILNQSRLMIRGILSWCVSLYFLYLSVRLLWVL